MLDSREVLNPSINDEVPLLGVLGRKACEAILARNSVGRIAFSLHDRVSIVPIHYAYADGWIYGRTAPGGKLDQIFRNRRVALEVDEHTRLFEWRSVVASGPLYLIEAGTTPSDRRLHSKAVSLIRRLVPSALNDSDPVPFRDQLFRVRVAELSGRGSGPTGGERLFSEFENVIGDPILAHSDTTLFEAVERVVALLPLAPESQVHVDAFDGVIGLTGTVEDAAERNAVEAAVLEVHGVEAIVQELETSNPSQQQPTPTEIAREAVRELRTAPGVADQAIKIVVEHGWLRVEGVANSRISRNNAVRRLRGVKGSRGVIDRLRVIPTEPAPALSD